MSKQRTVEAELGPRWYPLRDRLEKWSTEVAAAPGDEVVEKAELAAFDFRSRPGLYFRARVDEAKSAAGVREAAKRSLRDGLTSCLMRGAEASPVKGRECQKTRECERGEFCNELNHCGPPTQPYNLRAAYKTLQILSEEWIADVQETTNDLRLELLVRTFDDATVDDLPLAADLLTRAAYFLVVLDERPPTRALSPRRDRRRRQRRGRRRRARRQDLPCARRPLPHPGRQALDARSSRAQLDPGRWRCPGRLAHRRRTNPAGPELRPRPRDPQGARRHHRHRPPQHGRRGCSRTCHERKCGPLAVSVRRTERRTERCAGLQRVAALTLATGPARRPHRRARGRGCRAS